MSQNKNAAAGIGVIVILLTVVTLLGAFILVNQARKNDSLLSLEVAEVTNATHVIQDPLTAPIQHQGSMSIVNDLTIGSYCLQTDDSSPMRFGITFSGVPTVDGAMLGALSYGSKRLALPEYYAVAGQPFRTKLVLINSAPSSRAINVANMKLSIEIDGVEDTIVFDAMCTPN
ncbi:MAG: hypothetical protein Q4B06_01410 [Candidatus Saccharibacteria bacterium]|nr:hypothetical protein [Candidatus Saccharibacteria bacterium]